LSVIDLKFGKNTVKIEVPTQNLMDVLEGRFKEVSIDEDYESEQILQALQHPIGTQRLSSLVKRGQKIVIMASDITRPSPTRKLLPPLLEELFRAGVSEEDITIVFGMGIHRPHTREEQKALVGERVFNDYKMRRQQ
jgi:nickel-dependent lactate racemase